LDIKNYFLCAPKIIFVFIIIICNLFFILWFNKIILIFYISILIITYISGYLLGKHMQKLRHSSQLCCNMLDEALAAFRLSFAMAVGLKAQGFLIKRIEILGGELRDTSSKIARIYILVELVSGGLSLLLLWLQSLNASSWSMIFGAACIVNTLIFGWALRQLMFFALLAQARPLNKFILQELAHWSLPISQRVQPVNIQGSIELHDVSFAYPGSSILVIKNITLAFEAQKFYVLLGPSGSGKSTLLKLLMAQEFAQEGYIAFDGQDARSLEPTLLAQHFGVIRQESSSFAGSIRANILCGRDKSTRDLEEILYSHEIFDVILDLPMGLETYIFDRASNLSRLQLVIILLARALIHKPKIIFLDEIFKGLNNSDQARIANYLQGLDITRILVTHDLLVLRPDYIINQKFTKMPYKIP